MAAWRWACDDEHESLGMRVVLDGAGISYREEQWEAGMALVVEVEAHADRARELEHRMLSSHARRLDEALGAHLDRREQRGRHALAALVSLLAALLGLAVLLRLY